MASGKFDEELKRMSELVERLKPNTFVLFNESFAATNELEGSEIAGQITTALIEKDIKVCFVTHLHEFAEALYERKMDAALFLRAERLEDGSRTFKLRPGKPLSTSFGVDLYNRIFEKNLKQPSSDRGSGSSRTSVPELH
jgi:DNA mismatch repair ATPase MutS